MKRLILLLLCLGFAGGQTFSLSAGAHFANVQSCQNSCAAVTAAALTIPDSDSRPSDSSARGAHTAYANNYLSGERGNLLLSPDTNICVDINGASICIAAGATVLLIQSGEDLVIYDLYQKKPMQVSIVIEKAKLLLAPGRMLVLTKQNTQNFEDLKVNCHSISYRRPQEINLPSQAPLKAFVADFSIFSALATVQPLKRLAISIDQQDKLVLERILRGALVLSSSGSAAEPYISADTGHPIN